MENRINPKDLLESEYLARKQRNSSYSLRAFAKLLEIPSGRLSQLLSEKRRFTPKLGKKIANRLNLDPLRANELMTTIAERRNLAASTKPTAPFQPIAMDHFLLISDPIHFSLLSLLELDNFPGDAKSAADLLGISSLEARAAFKRLVRVGLVCENGKNFLLSKRESRATSSEISVAALRECHKKLLLDAAEKLETIPVAERDITSITMAIDPKKLPEAKNKIREFRRSLSEFLESGKKKEVYRINIQLVPVTKKRKSP